MSGESKHTPGPWRVRDAGGGIYDNTDDGVYDVVGRGPYGEITLAEEVDIHDANLIAAAPDLLEALEVTAGNIRSLALAGAIPEPYRVWLEVVESALAKAKGEG